MQIKTFVLDTNIPLHDPTAIFRFEENNVVIPSTVLQELDNKKTQINSQIGANARQVYRYLKELFPTNLENCTKNGNSISAKLKNGGTLILQSVHEKDLKKEETSALLNVVENYQKNDSKILRCAYWVQKNTPPPVILVTKDSNMMLQAHLLGIPVEDYKNDRITEVEHEDDMVIDLPTNNFKSIIQNAERDPKSEFLLPKKFLPKDKQFHPNQYIILKNGKQEHPVIIRKIREDQTSFGNLIDYCQHTFHNKTPFTVPNGRSIVPKDIRQWMLLDALTNPDIELVTVQGCAGTGKTFITLAATLQQTLRETNPIYEKILLLRPAVASEDLGFLPGDKEEKLAPYMQGYMDNLANLFPTKPVKKGVPKPMSMGQQLINAGVLEIECLGYTRSRNIPQSCIIIDEAQNMTPHQAKTIVTRAAVNTKLILMGDVEQIDAPFLDPKSNGLVHVRDRMKHLENTAHITLTNGVRSKLAELAAKLL